MPEKQNFSSHTQFDPLYHFFLAPAAFIYLILMAYHAVRNPDTDTLLHVVIGIWAVVAIFKLRLYPLKVQDRVIRLEERTRLKEILPPELQPRIGELTEAQLIALRFASDSELAGLVTKVLSEKMDSKTIKQSIQNWRPDFWRV